MADPNEYVFPQTPAKNKNFNRTGGLTKLELVAAMIYCAQMASPHNVTMTVTSTGEKLDPIEGSIKIARHLIESCDGEKN